MTLQNWTKYDSYTLLRAHEHTQRELSLWLYLRETAVKWSLVLSKDVWFKVHLLLVYLQINLKCNNKVLNDE